jgi:hypothetical protein
MKIYNLKKYSRAGGTAGRVTQICIGDSGMKSITLTQGKTTIVDDDMYEYLLQWKWCAWKNQAGNWYAVRSEWPKKIYMHRTIMDAPPDMDVDHRDRDGLHNWRENLRICTQKENNRNRVKNKNNRSGYKGVVWHKETGKYRSRIKVGGKHISLGLFDNPEDAALAYDKAAKEYFGPFASLNFQ